MEIKVQGLLKLCEEECIDILEESLYGEKESLLYKSNVTKEAVISRIKEERDGKVIHNKIPFRNVLLIAIICTLAMSMVVIGKYGWDLWKEGGAELITDINREIVGKEMYIENPATEIDKEEYDIPENTIVKSKEEGAHIPRTIDVFTTNQKNLIGFETPEIVTTNDAMVVFTTLDEKGWKLQKGDILKFTVDLYENGAVSLQTSVVSMIINGELQEEMTVFRGNNIEYVFTAKEEANYHIAITNASSDTISFYKGEIIKSQ